MSSEVFVPTNEWQIVKRGQEIPTDLDIRLNMDTLQKEARTVESDTPIHEIVVNGQTHPVTKDKTSSDDPDSSFSTYIQSSLVGNKLDQSTFRKYFRQLVDLHQGNKNLKPKSDFIQWLAEEVETRKEYKKRDDYSPEEKEFDDFMLRARHEVFGNPMGLRKAIADEL
ncbi:Nucleotide exchange factor SIL1 [Candida maltosa Xu316]|uniref:Nucleotide exchange factor SIL1 n=1 Tax=Candida maltosa (strain Xu316) TaxID=1245528 RepID=M3JYS1_CANMX|nr:Nucleotide exchange factor SIL1 [Candida maltosa Xu316]